MSGDCVAEAAAATRGDGRTKLRAMRAKNVLQQRRVAGLLAPNARDAPFVLIFVYVACQGVVG